MSFEKKVLVLKRVENPFPTPSPTSGILRIEIESGVAEFALSLINLPNVNGAEFFMLLVDKNGKKFFFPLGAHPNRLTKTLPVCPVISDGVSAGVYIVKNDIPITLMFAGSDKFSMPLTEFKKTVAERCLENKRSQGDGKEPPLPCEPNPVKPPYPPAPHPDPTVTPPDEFKKAEQGTPYNDEAVATENYYKLEQDISLKLERLKEIERENLQFEDELSFERCTLKAQEEHAPTYCTQNETDLSSSKKNFGRQPYYYTVQRELNEIFNKFPEEPPLKQLFSDSSFVRINYSQNKYYVVGLIKENGTEKYICYGVPGEYSKNPPEQLKGFCSFVPASLFNMTGCGYWMMFQDANSGDCIKMS